MEFLGTRIHIFRVIWINFANRYIEIGWGEGLLVIFAWARAYTCYILIVYVLLVNKVIYIYGLIHSLKTKFTNGTDFFENNE